jgi:hypothetical protein
MLEVTHPRSGFAAPLKEAEARGSKPACIGLDGPRNGCVLRPCGLQGTLVDRQSRIRGGRLESHRFMRRGSRAARWSN